MILEIFKPEFPSLTDGIRKVLTHHKPPIQSTHHTEPFYWMTLVGSADNNR